MYILTAKFIDNYLRRQRRQKGDQYGKKEPQGLAVSFACDDLSRRILGLSSYRRADILLQGGL